MKTGKRLGLPNVLFGNALSSILLTVFFIFFGISSNAQADSSQMTGSWFEVQKKHARSRVPLQLELKADSTARYINLYPEKSVNLTWSYAPDSILTLSDGNRYKLIYYSNRLMKLRTGSGAKFAWNGNKK
jgi:hypothetical protein